jgi:hypothetical protein
MVKRKSLPLADIYNYGKNGKHSLLLTFISMVKKETTPSLADIYLYCQKEKHSL